MGLRIWIIMVALGAAWLLGAAALRWMTQIGSRSRRRRLRAWERQRNEVLYTSGWMAARREWEAVRDEACRAEEKVRQAKDEVIRDLMSADQAAAYEAALSDYRNEQAAWDEYEEELRTYPEALEAVRRQNVPDIGWFGDHQVDYNEPYYLPEPAPPSPPGIARPSPPRLADYIDAAEADAEFNRRRRSGELAVPDVPELPPEPPKPPDPPGKPKPPPRPRAGWWTEPGTLVRIIPAVLLGVLLVFSWAGWL